MNQQDMMTWAIDQLRAEGVPEDNLRAAAAHLVGQAYMESGLNPNATHDNGTGYGIYGARLGRADNMLDWLKANGYPQNSAEGQMRYMAHEAMNGDAYGRTRDVLMNASPDTLAKNSGVITANFERPAVNNDRSGAVVSAYNAFDPDKPAGKQVDDFSTALADFNAHFTDLRSRYAPQPGGPAAPAAVPQAGVGINPQQAMLMQLLGGANRQPAAPQQANYGGIPSPNYAAAGGPSSSTADMLRLMMMGRQQNNALATLAIQNGSLGGNSNT